MKRIFILIALSLFSIFFAAGCSATSTPTPTSTSPSASPTASIAAVTTPVSSVPSTPTTTSVSKPSTPVATTPVSTQTSKYGGTLRWIAGSGPGAPMGAPWLANGTSVFGMQFAEQFLLKEMQDGSL